MTAASLPRTKLAETALKYSERGWIIVPLHHMAAGRCSCGNHDCPSPAKHPRTANGLQDATADATTVRNWWDRWPSANIGLRPGPSGFVVIDVDGPEGEASAAALGLLSEPTLEVVSGRADGGRHRYYRHPGGVIGNASLGRNLDTRADAGYVILPPSVHETGRVYAWRGRVEEVVDLPASVVARLTTATASSQKHATDQLPAWMIPWLEVQEGGRNNTLTRFVGWAYAQGHDVPTVMAMASGVNANWNDPLGRDEVDAIVKSIHARESRKPSRTTETGRILTVVEPASTEVPIAPADLAAGQVRDALARGRRDLTGAPRWAFTDLDALTGSMIPGDLIVVGSLYGNGKTSFLMSQMDWFASRRIATLYIPLELDPADLRRRWAAWKLGLDAAAVARNAWEHLPEGAQDAHEAMMEEQGRNPYVQFPPDRRVTLSGLAKWTQWAVEQMHAPVVMLDHFHRMDFGQATNQYRIQVTESVRAMKDLAREHGVVLIAASQLNHQDSEALDRYFPPQLKRLKESSGIGEEADLVLMLSRRLRSVLTADDLRAVKAGLRSERDFEEPNTMTVTCRKSRLEDGPRDRSVLLHVDGGRVTNRAESWRDHDYNSR